MTAVSRVRTYASLGVRNLARVAWYRASVKAGLNPVRKLAAEAPRGTFFETVSSEPAPAPAVATWRSEGRLFGYKPFAVSASPPDWFTDPFTGARYPSPDKPWWMLADFDPAVGDIKRIWELSRFDWAVAFAEQARAGEAGALERLNAWLEDWSQANPPYCGPNWKCGQETSIRVMHLTLATIVLGIEGHPAPALETFLHNHLQRIAPTMSYAIAQDNNHGVSEAVALFIGGAWLADAGVPEAAAWEQTGRRWMEERARRLIGDDGSFSQYSVNYHRLMLDAYCLAEVWRRRLGRPEFGADWWARMRAATAWLWRMVDAGTGDAPNLGANDGARLLPLTDAVYRDHRPTVQVAAALFEDARAWPDEGPWDDAAAWLGIAPGTRPLAVPVSDVGSDGGFAVLARGDVKAILRYPRFRFRPSQADALHLDVWIAGENLLRDAGTYSYNAGDDWLRTFTGTGAHNTVQFDRRDQMPRLGRFLFGDWLRTNRIEPLEVFGDELRFGAGYVDGAGASHFRRVILHGDGLRIEDEIDGMKEAAVLRWRLAPGGGAWQRDGTRVHRGGFSVAVESDVAIVRAELVSGWESRHYLEKTELDVFEVEVRAPAKLLSEIRWPE